MAEENFTLKTFYASWAAYQSHVVSSVAPLTDEQLALRAAPHLRTIGEIALHIAGCREGWFSSFLGEAKNVEGGDEALVIATWDEPDAPARPANEIVHALEHSWTFMQACVARWSPEDMQKTFEDNWDGEIVQLSRAWVLWHVLEHDLHHGGELSLTLGMHGLKSDFPG